MVRKKLRLPNPCLCLVTDRRLATKGELFAIVRASVDSGVGMVQLREKDLAGGELLALAEDLKRAIDGRALLVVNERLDVALACDADGVHLGERSLSVARTRKIAGDAMLVGCSVHSLDSAMAADVDGADYLIAGTMFETESKPGKMPEGLELMRQITGVVPKPVLGIGGITPGNASQLAAAGAAGAAVMSGILRADDPGKATVALRASLLAPTSLGTCRR